MLEACWDGSPRGQEGWLCSSLLMKLLIGNAFWTSTMLAKQFYRINLRWRRASYQRCQSQVWWVWAEECHKRTTHRLWREFPPTHGKSHWPICRQSYSIPDVQTVRQQNWLWVNKTGPRAVTLTAQAHWLPTWEACQNAGSVSSSGWGPRPFMSKAPRNATVAAVWTPRKNEIYVTKGPISHFHFLVEMDIPKTGSLLLLWKILAVTLLETRVLRGGHG